MSHDGTKLYLDFATPVINRSLVVLEADPFKLMRQHIDMDEKKEKVFPKTCTWTYHGPLGIIYSTKDKCIVSTDIPSVGKREIIVSPSLGCHPQMQKEDDIRYFREDFCVPTEKGDEVHFVQIKRIKDEFQVYCPMSEIVLEGRHERCPNNVFEVPVGVNMSISGVPFFSMEMMEFHETGPDPMFTMAVNNELQIYVNKTVLKEIDTQGSGMSDHHFEHDMDVSSKWWYWFVLAIFVAHVILFYMLCGYYYHRRNDITVQAHPVDAPQLLGGEAPIAIGEA